MFINFTWVFLLLKGYKLTAISLIFIRSVLDSLDGIVARKYNK